MQQLMSKQLREEPKVATLIEATVVHSRRTWLTAMTLCQIAPISDQIYIILYAPNIFGPISVQKGQEGPHKAGKTISLWCSALLPTAWTSQFTTCGPWGVNDTINRDGRSFKKLPLQISQVVGRALRVVISAGCT